MHLQTFNQYAQISICPVNSHLNPSQFLYGSLLIKPFVEIEISHINILFKGKEDIAFVVKKGLKSFMANHKETICEYKTMIGKDIRINEVMSYEFKVQIPSDVRKSIYMNIQDSHTHGIVRYYLKAIAFFKRKEIRAIAATHPIIIEKALPHLFPISTVQIPDECCINRSDSRVIIEVDKPIIKAEDIITIKVTAQKKVMADLCIIRKIFLRAESGTIVQVSRGWQELKQITRKHIVISGGENVEISFNSKEISNMRQLISCTSERIKCEYRIVLRTGDKDWRGGMCALWVY